MALVGLDVHQAQTVAAVLDPLSGELGVERLRGAPAEVVPVFLEGLARPVRAVYEAGPTGFGLARTATARGLDLRVMAPGSIPRAPGDRVKTDRRDARRLVRLFAAGELSFAFVPSEEEERFRDLGRCIDDARKDLMRARATGCRSSCCAAGCGSPGVSGRSRTSAGCASCAWRMRALRRSCWTTAARSTRSCTVAGR
jgi:transposase